MNYDADDMSCECRMVFEASYVDQLVCSGHAAEILERLHAVAERPKSRKDWTPGQVTK